MRVSISPGFVKNHEDSDLFPREGAVDVGVDEKIRQKAPIIRARNTRKLLISLRILN